MSRRNIAAFGIYADQISGGEAVDSFVRVGFRNEDIAILRQHNAGSKDFGHERHTKAPAMAAAGAVCGVLIGGIFGWLVTAGTFGAVPWLTPFLAPEHIGAVFGGIGAGSVLGLIIGALVGSAIPVYEARRYDGRIRNGEILLSAHCDNPDWMKRAEGVLRDTGARGIGTRVEARADFGSARKPLPRSRTAGILDHERVSSDVPAPIPSGSMSRDIEAGGNTSADESLRTVRRFSSDL
jgi:hypothetical protein